MSVEEKEVHLADFQEQNIVSHTGSVVISNMYIIRPAIQWDVQKPASQCLTQVYCYYCVATEFMENPKVAVHRGMNMENVTDVANVWFIYMNYTHTYVG